MVSNNYFYLIIICLHTVIWFHVFLSNTNDFQTDLFDPYMGPMQVLTRRVRVDPGLMAMKEYSILPKSLELKPHHQMQISVISRLSLF